MVRARLRPGMCAVDDAPPPATSECTFDPLVNWNDILGNGRVVGPPLPVIVYLASLFPPGPGLATPSPSRSPWAAST